MKELRGHFRSNLARPFVRAALANWRGGLQSGPSRYCIEVHQADAPECSSLVDRLHTKFIGQTFRPALGYKSSRLSQTGSVWCAGMFWVRDEQRALVALITHNFSFPEILAASLSLSSSPSETYPTHVGTVYTLHTLTRVAVTCAHRHTQTRASNILGRCAEALNNFKPCKQNPG